MRIAGLATNKRAESATSNNSRFFRALQDEARTFAINIELSAPLVFAHDPAISGPYDPPNVEELRANAGPYAIYPRHPSNSHFIQWSSRLCEMIHQTESSEGDGKHETQSLLYRELDRLSRIKGAEWKKQRDTAIQGFQVVDMGEDDTIV
jgi:hypothetical protein